MKGRQVKSMVELADVQICVSLIAAIEATSNFVFGMKPSLTDKW